MERPKPGKHEVIVSDSSSGSFHGFPCAQINTVKSGDTPPSSDNEWDENYQEATCSGAGASAECASAGNATQLKNTKCKNCSCHTNDISTTLVQNIKLLLDGQIAIKEQLSSKCDAAQVKGYAE